MDKLKELLRKCKCGVYLTVNEHRDSHMTVEESLKEHDESESPPDISFEVRAKMIETNTIIELQFYPRTPLSSYFVCHYDLDQALDEALSCLAEG